MAKLIPRRLPVQVYRILALDHKTDGGGHCANCGRKITWLATISGEESHGTHVVGMDCAATMVSAEDFEIWNGKMKAVQKVIRALKKYKYQATAHNGRSAGLQNRGGYQFTNVPKYALPRLVLDAGRHEVVVMIPRYYHAGQNPAFDDTAFTHFRATRPEWDSHWGSVEQKLRALGVDVAAPFLPAEEPVTTAPAQ